jgi:hypothetical protein
MKRNLLDLKSYLLRAVREELRLDVHLARMNAKERWRRVEPIARRLNQSTRRALATLTLASKIVRGER